MQTTWLTELYRFLWFGLVAVAIGLLTQHLQTVLLIFTFLYLGWFFYNLRLMETWLRMDKKYAPPEAAGVWGDMLSKIYALRQRSRKRSKRLVKLLKRFRQTAGAMPDGIVILEEQGDIDWWNCKAEELLNLKYPQDVGVRLVNLIRNPDFVACLSGESRQPDVTINSPFKDGVKLNIRPIPYGKNQTLVMVRDVTLIHEVEQMRRDFVGNISHELRTPLTVLSGYIESLQEDNSDNPDLERALELMGQQTHRMRQLTEDLMLLSSLESSTAGSKRQVVDVNQMLVSLREEAQVLSGKRNHAILLESDPTLNLRGDPKELDSIFSNLVVNAVNYTPEGGAIRIRWYADDNGAHFEVNDTGIGIPGHHLARLTERFYRVDVGRSRASGGSGLGLAIVKHAVQQHRGTLRIDSEVGRGSSFIVDFPRDLIVWQQAPVSVGQAG